MDESRQIREFWFGRVPLSPVELERRMQWWFGGEPTEERRRHDAEIRIRFAPLLEKAVRGELDAWAAGPRGLLSLIVLLDQFPRNIYRGTAQAFFYDEHALRLALAGMQSGADAALDLVERMFCYMPLQHAESRDVQDESIAVFRQLVDEAPAKSKSVFEGALEYAQLHREIIQRFGRFPHRNAVLGRDSTAEEVAYLSDSKERFGQ